MTSTTMIPIGQIAPENNDRTVFDEGDLVGLARSIDKIGLIQPITVRAKPDGDGYFLIAGERRWRACMILEVETIEAIVTTDDDASAKAKMLAENGARADLGPMEEALAFQARLDAGDTVEDVATIYGRSESYVQTRLDFLGLVPEVQDALGRSLLAGYAEAMVGLDHELQRSAFALLARREMTVVEFFEVTERMKIEAATVSMFDATEFSLVADEWAAEAVASNAHLHPKQMAVLVEEILDSIDAMGIEGDEHLVQLMARARRAVEFRLKKGEFAPVKERA